MANTNHPNRATPSERIPRKRTFNGNAFRSRRAYSFADIADTLDIHIRTVQRWRSEGLAILDDDTKPFLVMGRDIQDFLRDQAVKRKRPLLPGQFFCTKCQQPRKSSVENVQLEYTQRRLGAGHRQVIIHGVCEVCGVRLSLFSSEQKAANWCESARVPSERAETLKGNAGGCTNADIRGRDHHG